MTNPKKQPNKWMQLITIPFQMGFVIFCGVMGGIELDKYFNTEPVLLIVFSFLAIIISFYQIIKQLEQINKND